MTKELKQLKCSKCGEWKFYSEFYKSKINKSGYEGKCKECKKQYQKQYRGNNIEHCLQRDRLYYKNNIELRRQYRKNNIERYRQHNKNNTEKRKQYNNSPYKLDSKSKQLKEIKIYEPYIIDGDNDVNFKCTYCGEYFKTTKHQIKHRIGAINGKSSVGGESRFYCTQQCKDECPIFYKKLYREGESPNKNDLYTSAEYNLWRQTVLERGKYICQYCGKEANISHHVHPQKTYPLESLDPDNGIVCCVGCHYKYGHKTGTDCSTGNLANKVC